MLFLSFVEWYYEYVTKIFNKDVPLVKIAQRAKVKLSIEDYKTRCKQTTKAGSLMSRMAHMELAIKHKMNVNLGDVIYYVNNGDKASQGDVQKVSKPKKGWAQKDLDIMMEGGGKISLETIDSYIKLNCYMLNNDDVENKPDLTGDYNVPRALSVFNKRIEPLLVVFKQEVRDNLLVENPENRGLFTKDQCELINGMPFEDGDQDKLEEVMTLSEGEVEFWKKRGIDSNYIYELAEEGWENLV